MSTEAEDPVPTPARAPRLRDTPAWKEFWREVYMFHTVADKFEQQCVELRAMLVDLDAMLDRMIAARQ